MRIDQLNHIIRDILCCDERNYLRPKGINYVRDTSLSAYDLTTVPLAQLNENEDEDRSGTDNPSTKTTHLTLSTTTEVVVVVGECQTGRWSD